MKRSTERYMFLRFSGPRVLKETTENTRKQIKDVGYSFLTWQNVESYCAKELGKEKKSSTQSGSLLFIKAPSKMSKFIENT